MCLARCVARLRGLWGKMMGGKLGSDEEFRTRAEEFFRLARDSVCSSDSEARHAFRELRFRLRNGLLFRMTDEVRLAQHRLIVRCVEVLGARLWRRARSAIWLGSKSGSVLQGLLPRRICILVSAPLREG